MQTTTPTKQSIAEGPTLSALVIVHKAYSNTDAPVMFGRMLRDARWPSFAALLLSLLAVVVTVVWHSKTAPQAAAFLAAGCAYWLHRDAFRQYYARKRTAAFLNTFANKAQATRYIMFRESLPDMIATDALLLERLQRLLEQRGRVRRAGEVTRHPFVACLVAICLLFLGGLIAKGAEVSPMLMLTLLLVLGTFTALAMQVASFWRTSEYRDEELAEFVLWLWAEASENATSGRPTSGTGA